MQLTSTPVAFTGIAASLIDCGQTIHSRFGVPIPIERDSVSRINVRSPEAQIIRNSSLIIWDEASMCPAYVAECVDRLLRDVTGLRDVIFGGKCVVFGGDFRQTLPVVPSSDPAETVKHSLKASYLWPTVTKLSLTRNQRALPEEREFAEYLLRIGNGQEQIIHEDLVRIPDRCLLHQNESEIDFVFGNGEITRAQLSESNCAILTPTNVEAIELNELALERMPYQMHTYRSVDTVKVDEGEQDIFPVEVANSITPNGYPLHQLNLKEGAVIMLIKNLSIKDGLCNGTRLIVTRCGENTIQARILFGTHRNKQFTFPRVSFNTMDPTAEIQMTRVQFPFRLAFAMTINKSQGQTFDRICISLRNPVFAHGQLYTSMSRVRAFDHVKVKVFDINSGSCIQGKVNGPNNGVYTRNVVCREILYD